MYAVRGMTSPFLARLRRFQSSINPDQAVLLSTPTDITYLTGFEFLVPEEREALLLVTTNQAFLIHASFSPVAVPAEVERLPGCSSAKLADHLRSVHHQVPFQTLYVDKTSLFVDEYDAVQSVKKITLEPFDKHSLWQLRSVKDEVELAALRQASSIAIAALQAAQPQLKIGMTEHQFKTVLDDTMRQLGSERVAFPTIVAFGPHSAIPHYQPGDTPLTPDTVVLCDFGATVDGYRSDITRTWWFGDHPSPDFEKIKTIVHDAYQAALSRADLSTGQKVTAQQVDTAARQVISQAGYGAEFIHTTGHGVGLDIHEQPSLNWQNTVSLEPGMVVTIEPGIYLPDKLGYRHENTVLITDTTPAQLTLESQP